MTDPSPLRPLSQVGSLASGSVERKHRKTANYSKRNYMFNAYIYVTSRIHLTGTMCSTGSTSNSEPIRTYLATSYQMQTIGSCLPLLLFFHAQHHLERVDFPGLSNSSEHPFPQPLTSHRQTLDCLLFISIKQNKYDTPSAALQRNIKTKHEGHQNFQCTN